MKQDRVAQEAGVNRQARGLRPWRRILLVALAWALATFSLVLVDPPTVSAARLTTQSQNIASSAEMASPAVTSIIGGPTPTLAPTTTPPPTATSTPTLTTYNFDLTSAIKAAGWPQANSNWCGVATIAAIADFVKPGAGVTQKAADYALTDQANESEWGTPSWNGIGPYIPTDIARDFGTDPRSIAEGLTVVTGAQYHVIVDTQSAWDATVHMVTDLLNSHQPISVFVNHGEHSVLVSGVDATADPRTHPNAITGIHVWDPGGGNIQVGIQQHTHVDVPIKEWLSGQISWSGQYYFAQPYAPNDWKGTPLDPDPSVGPYSYRSTVNNHMWIGHWVYVSAVAGYATAQLNADWELTPWGSLYVGYRGSGYPAYPDGYVGPMTPMPTTTPPPPLPLLRAPVLAARTPWHGTPPKTSLKPTPKPTTTPHTSAHHGSVGNAGNPVPDPVATVGDSPAGFTCPAAGCMVDASVVWPTPTVIGFWLITLFCLLMMVSLVTPALVAQRARRASGAVRGVAPPRDSAHDISVEDVSDGAEAAAKDPASE